MVKIWTWRDSEARYLHLSPRRTLQKVAPLLAEGERGVAHER
jgi:hypothetical protein